MNRHDDEHAVSGDTSNDVVLVMNRPTNLTSEIILQGQRLAR